MDTGSPPVVPMGPSKSLRMDAVIRALDEVGHQPDRILEIGCGQGAFACRLAQWGEYIGLEPDRRSFSVAKERLAAVGLGQVRNANSTDFDSDPIFDLVCAFEVLEHLADDREAMAEWSSFLAPGGLLLVTTPADPDRYNAYDRYVGHLRRYTPDALAGVLRSAGLSDVRVARYGFPFYNLLEGTFAALARFRARVLKGRICQTELHKAVGYSMLLWSCWM